MAIAGVSEGYSGSFRGFFAVSEPYWEIPVGLRGVIDSFEGL